MAELIKGKLLTQEGEIDAAEALKDKQVVAVYFSAHWCPPCGTFTPILKDFFDELDSKSIAIIFVSSDRSEAEMKSYFKESHGDYYALPWNSETAKTLEDLCGVSGIPSLCVIAPNGKPLTTNGRDDVTKEPPAKVYEKWLALY